MSLGISYPTYRGIHWDKAVPTTVPRPWLAQQAWVHPHTCCCEWIQHGLN